MGINIRMPATGVGLVRQRQAGGDEDDAGHCAGEQGQYDSAAADEQRAGCGGEHAYCHGWVSARARVIASRGWRRSPPARRRRGTPARCCWCAAARKWRAPSSTKANDGLNAATPATTPPSSPAAA